MILIMVEIILTAIGYLLASLLFISIHFGALCHHCLIVFSPSLIFFILTRDYRIELDFWSLLFVCFFSFFYCRNSSFLVGHPPHPPSLLQKGREDEIWGVRERAFQIITKPHLSFMGPAQCLFEHSFDVCPGRLEFTTFPIPIGV